MYVGERREDSEGLSPIIDFPTPSTLLQHSSSLPQYTYLSHLFCSCCLLEYKLQEAKIFTYFVPRLIPVQYLERCRRTLLLRNCMWNQRMRERMSEGRNYAIPVRNTELGNKNSCDD